MKHNLHISVSKKPTTNGIVSYRNVSVREKFLRFLFGAKHRITILVPGDSVESLCIEEVREGGVRHEQDEVSS